MTAKNTRKAKPALAPEKLRELTELFIAVKTRIGGNREHIFYENTFGATQEERLNITPPAPAVRRLMGELEFCLHLMEIRSEGAAALKKTLKFLQGTLTRNGALTTADCEEAEAMLAEMAPITKEYTLHFAGHAHIDMNWMWSYNETVSAALATFRTVLNLMKQYPEFTFSQSQASCYKIVEEFDPEMMEEIKARIAEGRWECTASAWVETDKNMPSTESLLRHIEYTRKYLSETWGVTDFDIDFSPDTFGHNANIPEIDRFGGVSFFYHCRGDNRRDVIYRYKAPSGSEVLVYREPNWYNGAITNEVAGTAVEMIKNLHGLKDALVVYGVGDHGGGPTRRDVEQILAMQEWPLFPNVRFGTFREFFHLAMEVWDDLPVATEEINYFAPGCYTTQSRIKRANRKNENSLLDSETVALMDRELLGTPDRPAAREKAWQKLLFTHFHDIITGSNTQDSREYAMGLFQEAQSYASGLFLSSMRHISEAVDGTAMEKLLRERGIRNVSASFTQAEGAGPGYGVGNGTAVPFTGPLMENYLGVPSTERGGGLVRIHQVYNTLPEPRREELVITVWDWQGDPKRIAAITDEGEELEVQRLDLQMQNYWDHRFFRVLVTVPVPAAGYRTIALYEKAAETYPVYLNDASQMAPDYRDHVLENDYVRAVISVEDGRLISLADKTDGGRELIPAGRSAGPVLWDTERSSSSAWDIGRILERHPLTHCISLKVVEDGGLRRAVKAIYPVLGSKVELTWSLAKSDKLLRAEFHIDWAESAGETVPVLSFELPVKDAAGRFAYAAPGGRVDRTVIGNDVPSVSYGCALREAGKAAYLISDCKYGFRGEEGRLSMTLLNSSGNPDPYPERGIHNITLALGTVADDGAAMEKMAATFLHPFFYQPGNLHEGTLPTSASILGQKRVAKATGSASESSVIITSIAPGPDNTVVIRGFESRGEVGELILEFARKVKKARRTDLAGADPMFARKVNVRGHKVTTEISPYALFELRVEEA